MWNNRVRSNCCQFCSWSAVPVHAGDFGLARRVRPSRPASACSFSTPRLNLVPTNGIPPDFRGSVHYLFIPSYAIRSVPSLSGHATAYQRRSLPRVRRHRASKPPESVAIGLLSLSGVCGYVRWYGHVLPRTTLTKIMCVHELRHQR